MPNLAQPIFPHALFRNEYYAAHGSATPPEEIDRRWKRLSEEQQVAYAHRARAINQAAQDEFARKLAEGYRVRF